MHDASNTSSPPSAPCRCTRCSIDLGGLSSRARFCPCCGVRLSDRWHTTQAAAGDAPVRRSLGSLASTTDILRGYANAMFRLGVRYELRHNDDEAARCYGKASRLGNEPARARLTEIPVARVADAAS